MPEIDTSATSGISRRLLIASSTAALTVTASAAAVAAAPSMDYPFRLGVASGDPTPDGVVLWTRLAPKPFVEDWGMGGVGSVAVRWKIASDARMGQVVARGTATASEVWAHSVHLDARGLQPGRTYWYQFEAAGHLSPIGRTRTAPARGAQVSKLKFASVSCQDISHGFFTSYAHILADDVDFVMHLGDYVYEYEFDEMTGNRHQPSPRAARVAPKTLTQWRARHALYKTDPDLQRAHGKVPFIITWDDHEYWNDYAGAGLSDEGGMNAARNAAYRAYWEHMPLRAAAQFKDGHVRVNRRLHWGQLAQIDMLDGRQYRDVPACGWGEAQACEEAYDPKYSMLGREQEAWLYAGLAASTARWNIFGNNVMMSRLDHDGAAGDLLWHDSWDGFPANRLRLMEQLVRNRIANPVFVTGDWHSTFVNDIHRNFDKPGSPVIASEFVGTSVTTNGDGIVYGPYYGPMIKYNPHIKFFDGDRRGYQLHTVTPGQWRCDLRMVNTVTKPTSPAYTYASFAVADGRPGPERI